MNCSTWSVAKLVIATDTLSKRRNFSGSMAEEGDAVGPVAVAQPYQKCVPVGVTCVLRLLVITSVPFRMFNDGICSQHRIGKCK